MYFLNVIILFCLAFPIFGRPMQDLQDDDEEVKDLYGDKPDSDDYLHNERKALLNQDDLEPVGPENDYLENSNNDQADDAQPSHNMLLTNNKVKNTAKYNNAFFGSREKPRVLHNSKYNEDEIEKSSNLQFRKSNIVHDTDTDEDSVFRVRYDNKRADIDRDKRQIRKSVLNDSVGVDENSTQKNELNSNEDEEIAIRRHIKKLSQKELDELMQSLPNEEKTLLKNIIDSSPEEFETINKREITKKAGANEENSFVGNEQSDSNKVQGEPNIEAEPAIPNIETIENNKKSVNETFFSQGTNTVNTSEKSTDKVKTLDHTQDIKLEPNNKDNFDSTQMQIHTSTDTEQESSKNEKREINLKFNTSETQHEIPLSDNLGSDELYCSENEDLLRLWNEKSKLYDSNNINKREICSYNQESIRSLEDSFPKSKDTTNLKLESDMAPLIRVKRKNIDKIAESREVNDLKVPFHSNAVDDNEINCEGDDEGSEFDRDAFFDKRANFAVSEELRQQNSYGSTSAKENIKSHKEQPQRDSNNLESDIVSLGTDSDVVLSGIEGVDDNMMYNSVSRNRRTPVALDNLRTYEKNLDNLKLRNIPKFTSANEHNEISEENNNVLPYQENDAFGSLPRNYEEDLGRFKRIRRLKPLPNQDNDGIVSKE